MSIQLNRVDDPRLRKRIQQAMEAAGLLKSDLKAEIPDKPKRRILQDRKPLMNKLESEFQSWKEPWMYGEEGVACILIPQSIRFKLANGLWYKPDFFWPPRLTAFEVKGPHAFRGGFENLKMAAHQYPWIKWVLVWKEDGQWQEQIILP